MNEPNWNVEFALPEHLQKELDEVTRAFTRLIVEIMIVLYPDGDMPEDVVKEVLNYILPPFMESVSKHILGAIEELG